MENIYFEVYNQKRKKLKLTLEFEDRKDFYSYLRKNRYELIKYEVRPKKYRIKREEILFFTQNFRMLIESGVTITEALELLTNKNKKDMDRLIGEIRAKILQGNTLYRSFLPYVHIFGESYVNIILAGEESGEIVENLKRLEKNIQGLEKLRKKIQEAVFYPLIILTFVTLLIVFILTFVFPNFLAFFKDVGIKLPFLTRVLVHLTENIYVIVMFLGAIFLGTYLYIKRLTRREKENLKLKIPIYNKILKKRAVIEFCKNFSLMSNAGIEIPNILEILKRGATYEYMGDKIQIIESRIRRGGSITKAFEKVDLLSKTHLYLIEVGEKSGKLAKSLEYIARSQEQDLEHYIFKLTTLLEPVLLLVMGVVVGTVILAIYLPIFNISQGI